MVVGVGRRRADRSRGFRRRYVWTEERRQKWFAAATVMARPPLLSLSCSLSASKTDPFPWRCKARRLDRVPPAQQDAYDQKQDDGQARSASCPGSAARAAVAGLVLALTAPAAAQSDADYPEQADPHRRLGRGRRRRRPFGAHHRQSPANTVGPAGDGREPHRRQRQHRRRSGVARRAGRLHAAGDAAQHRSPPMPRCSRSSATIPATLRAGGDHGARPEHPGGEERLAGQDRPRTDRARQGQREAELRLPGQRLDLAPHVGAVQEPHRHPDHACALQGRGAGGERSRRRACRHDVLRPRHHPAAAPRRPGPDHRGGDGQSGLRCFPTYRRSTRAPCPASTRRRSLR